MPRWNTPHPARFHGGRKSETISALAQIERASNRSAVYRGKGKRAPQADRRRGQWTDLLRQGWRRPSHNRHNEPARGFVCAGMGGQWSFRRRGRLVAPGCRTRAKANKRMAGQKAILRWIQAGSRIVTADYADCADGEGIQCRHSEEWVSASPRRGRITRSVLECGGSAPLSNEKDGAACPASALSKFEICDFQYSIFNPVGREGRSGA